MVQRGDGVCTSINLNFRAWYEVEIRFLDNTQQKENIDEIILAQENKVCDLQIRYHFSKTHVAHLMVSKINFCQRDNRSANSNFIPCQKVEKWQWLIVSM